LFVDCPGYTCLERVQHFELWDAYFSQVKGTDALILSTLKRQE